jgi:Kdo2-lipid IVA lauroyltransferase/acyltransferase
MKYRWRHMIEYGALRAVSGLLVVLPHRMALGLAWGPARMAWALNGALRTRTMRRLRQALGGEIPEQNLRRIAWLAFRNLAFTAVEGMRLPGITPAWVARHIDPGPVASVQAELTKGHGLIVAVPHLGNWELAGTALQSQGVGLIALVRRQRNPLMNAWITRIRLGTGVEAIDTRSRDIGVVAQKLRNERKVLAILPDVRAKAGGVPVTFLGVETEVPGGAAHYARESGVPIATAEVVRRGWTQHAWRQTGRIEPDWMLGEADDRRRIMQYVMDRLGESVRAHPENYFWFNPRWVLGKERTT